jgi:hypothetical protein
VGGRVDGAVGATGVPEHAEAIHRSEDPPNHVVETPLRDLSGLDGLVERFGEQPSFRDVGQAVRRLERPRVEPLGGSSPNISAAGIPGISRSRPAVAAPTVLSVPCQSETTIPLESPLLLQDPGDETAAIAHMRPVDAVVGGHDRSRAGLDGPPKGPEVQLAQRPLVDDGAHVTPVAFPVVGDVVFRRRDDVLGLDALDHGRPDLAGEQGVLGDVLEVAPAVRDPHDVDAGSEHHVLAVGLHLAGERAPERPGELRVERRGQRHRRRERRRRTRVRLDTHRAVDESERGDPSRSTPGTYPVASRSGSAAPWTRRSFSSPVSDRTSSSTVRMGAMSSTTDAARIGLCRRPARTCGDRVSVGEGVSVGGARRPSGRLLSLDSRSRPSLHRQHFVSRRCTAVDTPDRPDGSVGSEPHRLNVSTRLTLGYTLRPLCRGGHALHYSR